MRNTILISKGHDLRISGVPKNHYAELIQIKSVCVMPLEFRNVKPKLIIKKDDKGKRIIRKGPGIISKALEDLQKGPS